MGLQSFSFHQPLNNLTLKVRVAELEEVAKKYGCFFRIILNVLGVEDYGIYNVVGSVVIFFGFLRQALTNATYRYCALK